MNKKNNYINLHSIKLQEALKKRDEYFNSLPTEEREVALKFQEFIDNELKKAGNQNNRITILHTLLMNYIIELGTESKSLSHTLLEFSRKIQASNKDESKK
ncbi:hypothetical protein [Fluviispira multicolorata]|uniref:Uncharacterized protein n=1 Tax=Fluviispira multicolorata TaxID=2654512 RepID=A0A833JD07_9BACT|nr:hypothetical protein [Fluviispira multicolorata]KAB8031016.1 hypothetical protein GCL57_08595 [Fluviispira multicolorata]